MLKRFFSAIFSSIKTFFVAIKNGLVSFFAFIGKCFFAAANKTIVPLGRFLYRYIIYLPLKYICLAVYKALFYVVFVPCRFIAVGLIYRFLLRPIGMGLWFIAKGIAIAYKKVIAPALRAVGRFIWSILKAIGFIAKKVGIFVGFVAKRVGIFIYRYILYPIFYVLRAMFLAVCTAGMYVGIFFYRFLFYPLYWFFEKVFLTLARLCVYFYRYVLYPIYFCIFKFFEYLYRFVLYPIGWFFSTVFRGIYKALCAVGAAIEFVFRKIAHAISFVAKKIYSAIKFVCRHIARFFRTMGKFLYQAVMVIIFMPIIIAFFILVSLISSPFFILFVAIGQVKQLQHKKIKRMFFSPAYILQARKNLDKQKIQLAVTQKPDIVGILKVRHFCHLVATAIWSIVLYPLCLLIFIV